MQHEDTYLAALAKRSQLFDGIGTDNLSALFSCLGARRVRLAKGELLLRTGEKADRIGIVLSGSLSSLGLITSRKSHFTLRRTV